MSQSTDSGRDRAPDAERLDARTEEREVASGRTAGTPVAMLGGVVIVVACAVVVVLALVVVAFYVA